MGRPEQMWCVAYRINPHTKGFYMRHYGSLEDAEEFYLKKKLSRFPTTIVLFKWERHGFEGEILCFKKNGYYTAHCFQYPDHDSAIEIAKHYRNHLYLAPGKITVLKMNSKPDENGVVPLWRA
jgi:hypothetical protein